MKDFSDSLIEILKKQCSYVGANYDDIDFSEDLWFMEFQWSHEQEANFINWMGDYLYNNTQARKDIMAYPRKRKKMCRGAAENFAFNYGWKYNDLK